MAAWPFLAPAQPADISGDRLLARDSIAWRLHQAPSMLTGGLRALLLQVWHPRIAGAVARHSNVASDPWGRLEATVSFMSRITYGSVHEAHDAIAHVRSVHATIRGHTADGTTYAADDPELLAYVHATLVDSALRAADAYGPRLTSEEHDRYADEMAAIATLLGVIAPPRDAASVRAVLYECAALRASREGRDLAWLLVLPPLPLLLRPAYTVLATGAVDLLPRRCAVDLGLLPVWRPARPAVRAATHAVLAALGAVSGSSFAQAAWERVVS